MFRLFLERQVGGPKLALTNECGNRVANIEWRQGVEVEMSGAINVGGEAIGGGDIVAGTHMVNVGHEAVDVDSEVVDEDNALTGFATSPSYSSVTSSLSAATSFFVSCPLGPPNLCLVPQILQFPHIAGLGRSRAVGGKFTVVW